VSFLFLFRTPDKDVKLVYSDPDGPAVPVHKAEYPQRLASWGRIHCAGFQNFMCPFIPRGEAFGATNCFASFPPCHQKLPSHPTAHAAKLFLYVGKKSRRSTAALMHRSNKRKEKDRARQELGPSGLRGKAKPAVQPTWLKQSAYH
jgi:hypothetical protein